MKPIKTNLGGGESWGGGGRRPSGLLPIGATAISGSNFVDCLKFFSRFLIKLVGHQFGDHLVINLAFIIQ